MELLVKKGEKTDLTKARPNLKIIIITLGWNTKNEKSIDNFEIDFSAFVLGKNGKTTNDNDLIFYNNRIWENGIIEYLENKNMIVSKNNECEIKILIDKMPEKVEKIAFTATIYDGEKRGQTFWLIKNAYIKVINSENGEELLKYELGSGFSMETAVVFGEIYRYKGDWKFNPIGSGYQDGLSALCKDYGVEVNQNTDLNNFNGKDEKLNKDTSIKADLFNILNDEINSSFIDKEVLKNKENIDIKSFQEKIERILLKEKEYGIELSGIFVSVEKKETENNIDFICKINGEINGENLTCSLVLKAIAYDELKRILGNGNIEILKENFHDYDIFSISFMCKQLPDSFKLFPVKI